MATTVIHDSCEAGALAGILAGRDQPGVTIGSYSVICLAAKAIADEFIIVNAAGAAMADADKASIGPIVQAIAAGILDGRGVVSATAADYINYATDIYNIAKEAIAVGALT
jgi:hypothetical protein